MGPAWDPYTSKSPIKVHCGTHIEHCDNKSFVYHSLRSPNQHDIKSNIKSFIFLILCYLGNITYFYINGTNIGPPWAVCAHIYPL